MARGSARMIEGRRCDARAHFALRRLGRADAESTRASAFRKDESLVLPLSMARNGATLGTCPQAAIEWELRPGHHVICDFRIAHPIQWPSFCGVKRLKG
eukprot:1208306-Pyramimonas_sp.AAC.1